MMTSEIFKSATTSSGSLAGVFEYDDDTGYFYLYDMRKPPGEKILSSIWILNYNTDLRTSDIAVRWNADETLVGLFIRGKLWAVFDGQAAARYGGDYKRSGVAKIPSRIASVFSAS